MPTWYEIFRFGKNELMKKVNVKAIRKAMKMGTEISVKILTAHGFQEDPDMIIKSLSQTDIICLKD